MIDVPPLAQRQPIPVDDEPPILVVGIGGSLRAGSYTHTAVKTALHGAAEVGAQTRFLDLSDYDLIFCDGQNEEALLPPGVLRLRRDVREAQGVILGTPEYHGSMSGVLKNALDLMGFPEFEGKMMGLIGVSAGVSGAFDALNSLRNIGRSLHAWVVPMQASIPNAWKAFDKDGTLSDPDSIKRLREVGRQVARFSFLHNSASALDFMHQWENAPDNPGGN